jgi:hypothetical protein
MARPIHFEIPADDPQRAIAFYSAALGWTAQKFDGMEYWMMTTGDPGEPGIDGGIAPRRDPEERLVNVMGVDSVTDAMRRIETAGGRITVPRMAIPGVGWVAYALDTEGNPFGVFRSDAGAS